MYELTRENVQNMSVGTLIDIWAQIDWDKVTGQRAMGIWDEFASKVKAAALTTNSYEKFIEKLCRKMEVRSLKFREINVISQESEELKKAVLKMFREETQLLVLKLRLNKQIRKEQAAQEQARKEKEKVLNEKLDNFKVNFNNKGAVAHEN